jgi:Trypsin-like peptidase domain
VRTGILGLAAMVGTSIAGQAVFAGDVESMKGSVVKIISKAPDGVAQTGTGFVVNVEGETIYIVTASHVVEGDPAPQVEFFSARNKRVKAEIGRREGADPRGLAYLIVRNKGIAEKGVKPLGLNINADIKGGQEVFLVGFGEGQGDWAVIRATIASMEGRDIRLDGRVEAGNSGGPVIQNGQVIGLVTQVERGFGVASPAVIVNLTLQGWGVKAAAATTATDMFDESNKQAKPTQPATNLPPAKVQTPQAYILDGQYGGRSYSQAADGQQYTCDFTALFLQTLDKSEAYFQNNCGDSGTIQGQIIGNRYRAKLNSVSLGSCELAAEIQDGGTSLTGQFQCRNLVGRFSMSRQ